MWNSLNADKSDKSFIHPGVVVATASDPFTQGMLSSPMWGYAGLNLDFGDADPRE